MQGRCIDPARRGILNRDWEFELLNADCHPITVVPGLQRLFLDACSGGEEARAFYPEVPPEAGWQARPPVPAHWPEVVRLLGEQNAATSPAAAAALEALKDGAGVVVTGQQVGLFGGPLYTPFKAASALARAREGTACGSPHVAVFWLATEDHDFAEINHVVFPARRELRTLTYGTFPDAPRPVGGVVLDETILPLVEQAWELLGGAESMESMEILAAAYQPGRSFAQAFAEFYRRAFAAQGLLVVDASSRAFHRLGAPVLRAGIEQADELHAALVERNQALEAAGYHAQVAVGEQSSLLFLMDAESGARVALKRRPPSAQEPQGLWQAGRQSYSTADLLGILQAEPERISPSALLRPVFQDFLFSSSAIVGGPAEIAYFAQSAVLYERILGRITPSLARFSATLIEPVIGELLRKHQLTLERVFDETPSELAQLLAARAIPPEGKRRLAETGLSLDEELIPLLDWMGKLDAGLGRSAETAASKMRYQMNRLRRLAANFQLRREGQLTRDAEAVSQALYPGGVLQERLHGAAYYFARYGFELAEDLTQQAKECSGHAAIWL
jgi:bacillithiol biosynthesis cysteine-adding enzyme BshC